ncbi:glycoside hydrolase family 105 protein [Mariniflexile sp. AS56]|uniref:glycoside hydrolase family 88/105 protein n=2 Tax=Mariniflexile sp. AS56 TaxID=3063957 RepID=UPI00398B2963
MKTLKIVIMFAIFAIASSSQAQEIKPLEVKKVMEKVADWQMAHFNDSYSGNKEPHHQLDWTNGALYVGMVKWAEMTGDEKYYNWLKEIGENNEWKLYFRKYHADDHTVGQLYIELYRKFKDDKMIKPTKDQFNFIMLHPAQTLMNWKTPYHQDRWNWCDALFMSPPVWAKLYNITREEKYLDFLMKEYKASTDFLFDKKESLYYRDEKYIGKLDNGTKIFWARGNGWVFAGLVNIMNELDSNSKEYKYFLKIYKKMANKLLKTQTPQGHWAMSILGQDFYTTPETSGSSFFIYGLAWGLNNGVLDKTTYAPAVKKGWNAMVGHVTEDGMLGYVQPIGAAPGKAWPDKTEVYGTGAFLSAGTEVYKLYGGE